MSKIVVLMGVKPRVRKLKTVGYFRLKKKSYEIWDISKLYTTFEDGVDYHDSLRDASCVNRVKSLSDLKSKFKGQKNEDIYYIPFAILNDVIREKVFSGVREYNGSLVLKRNAATYGPLLDNNNFHNFQVWGRHLYRIISNVLLDRYKIHPSHAFVPTVTRLDGVLNVGPKTKIFPIHAVNYDRYLDARESSETISEKPYAVFLSQYLPFHAELDDALGNDSISPDKYYSSVKAFFDRFLRDTDCNVDTIKIAAHPNADLEKIRPYWEEYDVYQNKTALLVEQSECVLAHYSEASQFAAISNKPICFFGTKPILKGTIKSNIEKKAELFGRIPSFPGTDDSIDHGVDTKRYKQIMNYCIKTPGTPDVNSWVYMYNKILSQ